MREIENGGRGVKMEQKLINVLNGILNELHKLNECSLSTFLTSLATVAAAIFTAVAAGYSKVAAESSRKALAEQKSPFMVIDHLEAVNEDNGKFPVLVYLTNIGKGAARIMVVNISKIEFENNDIRADIGTPISVAPSGQNHVKFWLPEKGKEIPIIFSVYYWDIEGICYRTKYSIILHITENNEASYGTEYEVFKNLGSNKKHPDKVKHWNQNRDMNDEYSKLDEIE